jgi:selenocysteine-specific elongation factor
VHLGAAHRTGRIALLGTDRLAPGDRTFAQVVLDEPIHCAAGDICVLRDASASRSLGGGPVLDVHAPTRHRRRPERLAALAALALTDDGAALAALIETAPAGVDLEGFARDRNRRVEGLALPADAVRAGTRLFAAPAWAAMQARILASLADFHAGNADEPGPQAARLRRMALPQQEPEVAGALFDALIAAGRLARSGPWLHLPEHEIRLSPTDEALAQEVRRHMIEITEPVWVRDLAGTLHRDETALRTLMLRLMKRGELLQVVRDLYVTPALATRYAETVARLEAAEGAAPAARFRDETGLGRKRAIQVLEFFDRVGYTRRAGEVHRLRGGASPAMFGRSS